MLQLFIQFIICILILLGCFDHAGVCVCVFSVCVRKAEFINIFIVTSGVWILPFLRELMVPQSDLEVDEGNIFLYGSISPNK